MQFSIMKIGVMTILRTTALEAAAHKEATTG
jgi:hypothetical protein